MVYFMDAAEGSCVAALNPHTGRVPHEQNPPSISSPPYRPCIRTCCCQLPWASEWWAWLSLFSWYCWAPDWRCRWPECRCCCRPKCRQQRLAIKRGTKWRWLNYDLHQVLGFYAVAGAFVIALGLFMDFGLWLQAARTLANAGRHCSCEEALPRVDTLAAAGPHATAAGQATCECGRTRPQPTWCSSGRLPASRSPCTASPTKRRCTSTTTTSTTFTPYRASCWGPVPRRQEPRQEARRPELRPAHRPAAGPGR